MRYDLWAQDSPHSVQQTQGGAVVWKLKENPTLVLTLSIGLLFLGQWHSNCEVTSSKARRIQEPNFCHDSCKNLVKMRQAHQGAVGWCKKKYWHFSDVMELHFMLLWLLFKLWVWHREPHFLNSLLYLSLSYMLFYFMIRSFLVV